VADPNRALFESIVRLLAPVLDELVFVGGCTTGLFITDPAAGAIRPTKDVDAIVDVTSYAKYTALSERLRQLGLAEDSSPGAPLCRWRRGDLIVDVMPIDERVLGFSNRWYPRAIETAQTLDIAGHNIRVVTPALFVATKLEAFHGRGGDDVSASHDLEDIIAVVDGGRRSWPTSLPLPSKCACISARKSKRFWAIPISPRQSLASYCRTQPARRDEESSRTASGRSPRRDVNTAIREPTAEGPYATIPTTIRGDASALV
jgi:hypothetical protein